MSATPGLVRWNPVEDRKGHTRQLDNHLAARSRLFATGMEVPQRTLPFPASIWEVAVDAVLQALRGAAAAAVEELAASDPDLSLLGTHAEEIGRSTASLLERWRHLDETSPYRDGALEIAVTVVEGVMGTAQTVGPAME